MSRFEDRRHAGRVLARALDRYARQGDVAVLALPRGGVPVAYEVALALDAPLDVFVVRKIGVPGHEELALGAIATGGVTLLNDEIIRHLHPSRRTIDGIIAREKIELQRREGAYRDGRAPLDVRGKTVIVVDDGLATGASMRAAIDGVRQLEPSRLVVAVPVSDRDVCSEMHDVADDVVCAVTPARMHAVGMWYDDFNQTDDDEVRALLAAAAGRTSRSQAVEGP
jgi:predicted phosphoribosyltransferase